VEANNLVDLAGTLAQLQHWLPRAELREGQNVGEWHIELLVAESRQSLVYRVRDAHARRWLLKTQPPSRNDGSQAGPTLLLEEWFLQRMAGRFFAKLQSPATTSAPVLQTA
jgi:hypothetical protein